MLICLYLNMLIFEYLYMFIYLYKTVCDGIRWYAIVCNQRIQWDAMVCNGIQSTVVFLQRDIIAT